MSLTAPLGAFRELGSLWQLGLFFSLPVLLLVVCNVLKQSLYKKSHEPPVVFHWFPFIGSTVTYGIDPYKFFSDCQRKYGDCFTFILLGNKTTVYLGAKGNDMILNGKHKDVNAEDVYNKLCEPVFGPGVVYDCPNSRLMEHKKMIKSGLSNEALESHIQTMIKEIQEFLERSPDLQGASGTCDILPSMAETIMNTATASLFGKEVREKFDTSFAGLFHDLDLGFAPINFLFPRAPLPHNRKRDRAQQKMSRAYMQIISSRRKEGKTGHEKDLIWALMDAEYKDGTRMTDQEIASLMIAILLAGQHSACSTISWIMTWLATKPDLIEALYQEQLSVLGSDFSQVTLEGLRKLQLSDAVIKETLRLNQPIHSIMRRATSPLAVEGTDLVIPPGHNLLASPGFMSRQAQFFSDPLTWDPYRWREGHDAAKITTERGEKVDYGYGVVTKVTSNPYLPFGAGRHRCIGESFAYVQLATTLAVMIRTFKWKRVDEKAPLVQTDYSSMFSKPMSPSLIQWERRDNQKT